MRIQAHLTTTKGRKEEEKELEKKGSHSEENAWSEKQRDSLWVASGKHEFAVDTLVLEAQGA